MYRAAAFRDFYFLKIGQSQNAYNTYSSYLGRIDRVIGGLDEKIETSGVDWVINWGKTTNEEPFSKRPSDARAVLNAYLRFISETELPNDLEVNGETVQDPLEATGTVFRIEREMQAAVRRQLTVLEPGLREVDGGLEFTVGTGRLDILAEDAQGQLVVIELKAGLCPPGALEQTLGYAEALSKERGRPVRAFLVAAEFSDRVRAAAKRTLELELRTYEFSLRFHEVS